MTPRAIFAMALGEEKISPRARVRVYASRRRARTCCEPKIRTSDPRWGTLASSCGAARWKERRPRRGARFTTRRLYRFRRVRVDSTSHACATTEKHQMTGLRMGCKGFSPTPSFNI
eukprot:30493-Pelagococcus_subviridis.AAC.4